MPKLLESSGKLCFEECLFLGQLLDHLIFNFSVFANIDSIFLVVFVFQII